MGNVWNQLGNEKQWDLIITTNLIQNQCRKMPTLMVLGKDGVQDFWLKNFDKSPCAHSRANDLHHEWSLTSKLRES